MRLAGEYFYEFGSYRLLPDDGLLMRAGSPVPLPPKAVDTLLVLVRHSGRVVSKDELMQAVWPDTFVEEANLTQTISTLRKALTESTGDPSYIETIPKRGYRFVAPVHLSEQQPAQLLVRERTRANILIEDVDAVADQDLSASVPAPTTVPAYRRKKYAYLTAALLLAVMAIGLLYLWQRTGPGLGPGANSIAVLPFQALSGEESDDILAMGMTEALIEKLSHLQHLTVRPATAVGSYGRRGYDPIAAGHTLKVDTVLEGTLQRSAQRIRVTVKLLRVEEGSVLWAATLEEQLDDIFAVQDSIAARVAEATSFRLTSKDKQQLAKRHTHSAAAYRAYLQGRYAWNRRTRDALLQSVEYFRDAIEIDPDYAPAFVGLADAYTLLGDYTILPPREAFPRAKRAALKAVALEESVAEAHNALAYARLVYDWDTLGAEREFRRAIQLNPSYATAYHWYAMNLSAMGRHQEAEEAAKRAYELDPVSPMVRTNLGLVAYYARQYDQAIQRCRAVVELEPNFHVGHWILGLAYLQQEKFAEAVGALEQARKLSNASPDVAAALGYAYGRAGQKEQALQVLRELERLADEKYVAPYLFGEIHLGVGNTEQALELFEKSYEERLPYLLFLPVEPTVDTLRSNPRFQSLLRRLNFPPEERPSTSLPSTGSG